MFEEHNYYVQPWQTKLRNQRPEHMVVLTKLVTVIFAQDLSRLKTRFFLFRSEFESFDINSHNKTVKD